MKKLIRSIALLAALSAVITIGGGGATAAAKVSCVMLPSTVEYKNVLHMGPGGDFAFYIQTGSAWR